MSGYNQYSGYGGNPYGGEEQQAGGYGSSGGYGANPYGSENPYGADYAQPVCLPPKLFSYSCALHSLTGSSLSSSSLRRA